MKQTKSEITYQLLIVVKKESSIQVGRLGKFTFPAGFYIYTGSAKKNMEARIKRHFRKRKKKRWHIDYLTTNRAVKIMAVRYSALDECEENQQTGGKIIAAGFGASDCRNGCGSHLKFLGTELSPKLKELFPCI